jgi:hypothetical protein
MRKISPSAVGVFLEEPEFCVKKCDVCSILELTVGHRNKMPKSPIQNFKPR